MFDFAWSEIAVVTVVALVVIGPKDMPVALKAVTDMIKKARRMAGEFQTHVDEMMREADLGEVREQFNEIRNFNLRSTIERAVDSDGSIRRTLTENPLAATSGPINPMHPTPPTIQPAQRVTVRTIGPAPVATTATNPFDFTRAGGAVVEPLRRMPVPVEAETLAADAPLAAASPGAAPAAAAPAAAEMAPAFIPPSIAAHGD